MGEGRREGEGRRRRSKAESDNMYTRAHATTNGEGRGGRGLAQPASQPIPPVEERREAISKEGKENLWHSPVWLLGLSCLYHHLHTR